MVVSYGGLQSCSSREALLSDFRLCTTTQHIRMTCSPLQMNNNFMKKGIFSPVSLFALHQHLVKVYLQAGIRSTRLSTLDLSRDTILSFTSPHYTRSVCNPKISASPVV